MAYHMTVLIIAYLGLLISHLSTTVIILVFISLVLLSSSILERYQVLYSRNKKLIGITMMLLGTILLAYELYVDVYLIGLTLRQGVQRLIELYVHELEIAKRCIEYNPYISIIDLVTYLISQYTKHFIILLGIGFFILHYLFRYSMHSKKGYQVNATTTREETVLFTLLISSLPTWLIGWFGVGSFMSGGRALPLIQLIFWYQFVTLLEQK